jgi:Tol biopolymer transport system component
VPPEGARFEFDVEPFGSPALSPDGRNLVFGARWGDGTGRLWMRALDSIAARPLRGTDAAAYAYPFWSPDGRMVGFSADGKLKKIDLSSGFTTVLTDTTNFGGGSWNSAGTIVFAPKRVGSGALMQIPAAGGARTTATVLDTTRGERLHTFPWFLPDGRHFLYFASTGGDDLNIGGTSQKTVNLGSLDSYESRIVTHADAPAVYASGYLLFLRDSVLLAQPFDDKRFVTTGEPVPIGQQVAEFTASGNGALVFEVGTAVSRTLAWLDREGKMLGRVGEPGTLGRTFLSRDGKRAVTGVFDRAANNRDLWIYDLLSGRRRRLTFDPASEQEGIWSPDGRRIIFSSARSGVYDLYIKRADGSGAEELLYANKLTKYPSSWSPDGRFILYYAYGDPKTGNDIWVLPLEGERKPVPFLRTGAIEQQGQFSPDGKWVAYRSNESGRFEIHLAPFPGPGVKYQVSIAGGEQPRWRGDGKELFYIGSDGRLMAVPISAGKSGLVIGAPQPLFGTLRTGGGFEYDVSADGQRILAVVPNEKAAEPLSVVLNWTAGLKK